MRKKGLLLSNAVARKRHFRKKQRKWIELFRKYTVKQTLKLGGYNVGREESSPAFPLYFGFLLKEVCFVFLFKNLS